MAGRNPIVEEVLADGLLRWQAAAHGTRGEIVRELAQTTQLSVATVHRKLRAMAQDRLQDRPRKRRRDAGEITLTHDEAVSISAYLMESCRGTGKQLAGIDDAVQVLRSNGRVLAGRVDQATGELKPLSNSAISRALKAYRLHPDQLTRPTAKVALASAHPNHCWQIDPSLCVLYYLKREAGLRCMPQDEFYKNKPQNLARVQHERVWRYVVWDHTTGCIYVHYVLGAESAANLCNSFIAAMQDRGPHDPFRGVPRLVMVDPGSANTSAPFRNLCAALGVDVWINQPGQPWAKGGVEKGNDLVERKFEHRLKLHRVESLDELNAAAWRWMRQWNATAVHSRHGMTRYAAWQTITAEQLVLAPAADVCRNLAASTPVEREVNSLLRVSFRGRSFDVSGVPGVMVGDKLTIARNAFADDSSANVIVTDEHGKRVFCAVPMLERDRYGFEGAVMLGEFRQHAATPADVGRSAVERRAMAADSDEEAAAKRKAKALPFGGELDPYKDVAALPEVAFLPRAGTPARVDAPAVVDATPKPAAPAPRPEIAPLNHVAAAAALKPLVERAGGTWTAKLYQRTTERWPDGLPFDQVDAWAAELTRPERPALRVVGGVA